MGSQILTRCQAKQRTQRVQAPQPPLTTAHRIHRDTAPMWKWSHSATSGEELRTQEMHWRRMRNDTSAYFLLKDDTRNLLEVEFLRVFWIIVHSFVTRIRLL